MFCLICGVNFFDPFATLFGTFQLFCEPKAMIGIESVIPVKQ